LQLTAAQRRNARNLASDLTYLIDRYFARPITSLSDSPDGVIEDTLPRDRDRLELTIGRKTVDLELVRVKDSSGSQVWLISSRSLAQVPTLRQSATGTWIERLAPEALETSVLGFSLAWWAVLAGTIVIPFAMSWVLLAVVVVIARRSVRDPARRQLVETWDKGMRWLVVALLTIAIHLIVIPFLGFSLRFRFNYNRVVLCVAVVLAACLVWRFLALTLEHTRVMAQRRGQAGIGSLILLAERVCKALVVMAAIFVLLTIAGVNTTTALAGVGIGGVAIALGAQKSVENLLGGVFLLTDRALAIGDFCSISNRAGVVEDVTLRSVRLRTVEQTLLSVPAGMLSQSNVENFATRHKILVQCILRLSYGTTAEQLRVVLNEIHTLLVAHSGIETDTARIRLVDFGVRAIELELFAYVLTSDFNLFLATREDLLLQVATIIESSGASFAQPELFITPGPAAANEPVVHSAS
jgi:MscS family membrane protein